MPLNLNRASLALETVNVAVNDAIERATAAKAELPRPYLGASIVGSECLRKVQYDWWCKPTLSSRVRDIFERGHYFEDVARQHLIATGFKFAPPKALAFSAVNGDLRGHADGIVIAGPNRSTAPISTIPSCGNANVLTRRIGVHSSATASKRHYPQYAAQIALYQAYLDITNPALFTTVNADTCERLHFWVPFSAERAQEWSDRAVYIIEATRAGELLPRAYDDPQDWRCRMCAHVERCWR